MHTFSLTEQIKEIMATQREQEFALSDIDFILEEDHSLAREEIVDAVSLLLEWVIQEKNQKIKDDIFSAIYSAVFCRHVAEDVDWDGLATTVPNLENGNLIWVFPLLGASGKQMYLPLLEGYKESSDAAVKEEALDAIQKIVRLQSERI